MLTSNAVIIIGWSDFCCLLGGLFLIHLAGVWLSKFGLHLLHIDPLQSFTRCGPLQAWQGPMLF